MAAFGSGPSGTGGCRRLKTQETPPEQFTRRRLQSVSRTPCNDAHGALGEFGGGGATAVGQRDTELSRAGTVFGHGGGRLGQRLHGLALSLRDRQHGGLQARIGLQPGVFAQ